MDPIEIDKQDFVFVHAPYAKSIEPPVPEGEGWWLHHVIAESRAGIGGLWLLYRRDRGAETQPAPDQPTPPA